jgi:hypothetical protein
MNTKLADLFTWYAIPPSALHEVLQAAARQAGWRPPWDLKEKRGNQKSAGKISGIKRGLRAEVRRTIVREAFRRLKSTPRVNPYADESIKALIFEYHNLVSDGCNGNRLAPSADDFISFLPELLSSLPQTDQQALKNVGREALLKDMKALGIRSRRRA